MTNFNFSNPMELVKELSDKREAHQYGPQGEVIKALIFLSEKQKEGPILQFIKERIKERCNKDTGRVLTSQDKKIIKHIETLKNWDADALKFKADYLATLKIWRHLEKTAKAILAARTFMTKPMKDRLDGCIGGWKKVTHFMEARALLNKALNQYTGDRFAHNGEVKPLEWFDGKDLEKLLETMRGNAYHATKGLPYDKSDAMHQILDPWVGGSFQSAIRKTLPVHHSQRDELKLDFQNAFNKVEKCLDSFPYTSALDSVKGQLNTELHKIGKEYYNPERVGACVAAITALVFAFREEGKDKDLKAGLKALNVHVEAVTGLHSRIKEVNAVKVEA